MDSQSTVAVDPRAANAFAFRLSGPDRDREFVLDFVAKSTAYNETRIDIWDEATDNYFVIPHGQRQKLIVPNQFINPLYKMKRERRSTLKDPELHQVIETLATQAVGLLLSSRDYIQVVPVGADDYEKARILGRILMATLEQPGWYRTHYQAIKNAFIYGTAIVELAWEKCSRMQITKVPQFDDMGQLIGYDYMPDEVVYRDAPFFREVDRYNFYPDPSGTRIQMDMVGVAKRGQMTKMQAQKLSDHGAYPLKENVTRAIEAAKSSSEFSGAQGGRERQIAPDDIRGIPDDFGVLDFFEYWGTVPYKPSDGATNRVITILNDQVVRSHINPFIDGCIPFKEIVVNPVAGKFDGLAPTEVLRFLQDSADNMLMVLNDVADAAVRSPLIVGSAFGGDIEALKKRDILDIIEARNVDAVKPLPVDLNALQFAGVELFRRKSSIRDASGANAQQLLSEGGKTQSATEASELVRLTSQRVELMVQLMERDDYPWIGRTLHSRLKQFLPPGGGTALFQGETMEFTVEDIDFDADVRFVGSRHNMSPVQVMAQYREALNVLGTNPGIVMAFPEIVVRYLRDGLKILDAERIVGEAMKRFQIQQAQAVLMGAQSESAAPGQGSSVGGSEQPIGTAAGETEREGAALA